MEQGERRKQGEQIVKMVLWEQKEHRGAGEAEDARGTEEAWGAVPAPLGVPPNDENRTNDIIFFTARKTACTNSTVILAVCCMKDNWIQLWMEKKL